MVDKGTGRAYHLLRGISAMFRVEMYENPIGQADDPTLVNENLGEFFERSEALNWIERHIAEYRHWGYSGEQDSWWCRNDGDQVVKTFVIRAN
jgi:hypothetical protein